MARSTLVLATRFLGRRARGTAYVIGGAGLTPPCTASGSRSPRTPGYVVVGETRSYDYEKIECGPLILRSRFIGQQDLTG